MVKLALEPKTGGNPGELDSDYYRGVIVGVELTDREPDVYHKEAYHQIQIKWILDDGTKEGCEYTTWVNPSLHIKSTMWAMLNSIGIFDKDVANDTDNWVGKECRVKIEQFEKDGQLRTKCVGYAPLRGRKPVTRDEDEDIPF